MFSVKSQFSSFVMVIVTNLFQKYIMNMQISLCRQVTIFLIQMSSSCTHSSVFCLFPLASFHTSTEDLLQLQILDG